MHGRIQDPSAYAAAVIVSMHVATGAAGGAFAGSRLRAALLGLVLHGICDRIPHWDIASRRFEVRSGLALLGALAAARGPVRSGRRRRGRFVGTRPRACPAAAETGREEALPDPSCRQLAPDRRCAGRRATLRRRRHRRAALESAETRARPVTGREGPRNQDPLASLCRADFAATHPLKDPSSHSSASHRRAAHGRTRRVGILGKSAACDTRFAHELAAFGRASAHSPMAHGVRPPTAGRTSGFGRGDAGSH